METLIESGAFRRQEDVERPGGRGHSKSRSRCPLRRIWQDFIALVFALSGRSLS